MTQNTTWVLDGCEYSNSAIDGLEQVVTVAHYRVNAEDDTKPGVIGTAYGAVSLGAPPPASFTPLASVTKAMIIGWTKDALGADAVADTAHPIRGPVGGHARIADGQVGPASKRPLPSSTRVAPPPSSPWQSMQPRERNR